MPQKPLLQHVTLNSRGRPASTSVTITELDGDALGEPIYDTGGNVISSPVSSSAEGLLQVFTRTSRSVLVTPDGATEGIISAFNPDPTAGPLHVTDFAPVDVDLTLGEASASSTFSLAMAAALASGRPLHIPPGTYDITSTLTIPSTLRMYGDGAVTVLRHGNTSAAPVITMVSGTNAHLSDFIVDGNYSNNNGTVTGFLSAEVFIASTGNVLERVTVQNMNCIAVAMGGDATCIDCEAVGIAAASYLPTTSSNDVRSVYGFITSGDSVAERPRLIRCKATGFRSAGIYVGGSKVLWEDCYVDDCHRGLYPETAPGVGSGGGQAAIPTTTLSGGGSEPGTDITIINLTIGPSPDAISAAGLEVNTGAGVRIINPTIRGAMTAGIVFGNMARAQVIGGQITGCALGVDASSTSDLEIIGTQFLSTTSRAIRFNAGGSEVDYWRIIGCGFKSNTRDFENASSGSHYEALGNQTDNSSNIVPTRIGQSLTIDPATGNTTVRGKMYLANQALLYDSVPLSNQTVTNGNSLDLGVVFGLAKIYDRTNARVCIVELRGATGAVVAMSAATTGFTINADSGTDIALFYSSGYKIKNRSGADVLIDVKFEGF